MSKTVGSRDRASARSRQSSEAIPWDSGEEKACTHGFLSFQFLHTLHLYGAAGIAAFGWAWAHQLGFDGTRYTPLWLAGALLVYNSDRLKHDPSDARNTPRRLAHHLLLRRTSLALTAGSVLVLLAVPLLARDWMLLFFVIAAGLGSLSYSFPFFGVRAKDIPLVKTLFAPTIVTLACFFPLFRTRNASLLDASPLAWAWIFLLFNMTVCDLRDLPGDRASGTKSLPVLLGEKATRTMLFFFVPCLASLAFIHHWFALAVVAPIYLAALLFALRKKRGEAFYEWFVEGMLFLPAVLLLVKTLVS